jgi:hypothetical protein
MVRRISRTMFVRAAEMVRRPGLFRAENDAGGVQIVFRSRTVLPGQTP